MTVTIVAVMGDYFIAKDIGFENSAGPDKHQAIALKVAADKSIFYNCHVDGYQDTLCVHTYRQFYRGCTIRGTIDFVFGDGAAVFQNCTIAVRKPLKEQHCIVTAQGRTDARQPTGLVFQNCSIVADDSYNEVKGEIKTYLGRPWKQYSRTVIMESSIGDLIQPEGWLEWNKTFAFDTLFYTEFNNIGSGSSKTDRVNWSGVKELPMDRVQRFTASKFLDGDVWIPSTGVPYTSGFFLSPPQSDASIKYSPLLQQRMQLQLRCQLPQNLRANLRQMLRRQKLQSQKPQRNLRHNLRRQNLRQQIQMNILRQYKYQAQRNLRAEKFGCTVVGVREAPKQEKL